MLNKLKEKNNIEIYSIFDDEFMQFGRIIYDFDTSEIINVAQTIENPEVNSKYIASEEKFEKLDIAKRIKGELFGEINTQIGFCWGYNNFLNATEWHTSSEINIAITDLVLILGRKQDIINNRINSSSFKAFFVPKGSIIEVYATSLHFCPCQTSDNGFKCIVALPKGTNTPLENKNHDKLLFAKNKWLLSHVDNKNLLNRGAIAGIYGENFKINY